ncbi:lysophospholipid acyltransferase family protein [Nakamurella deserti]|uniref:lysophospholipid acyltransferase family protein n=1 Tax=Nakamurella deserti TaxID=2164074 RepID=UPI000DBE6E20|nr:lysophospholipid acyltransferase family protein [Nakamurella deserti]
MSTARVTGSGCHHLPAPRSACVAGCVAPSADLVGMTLTWWRMASLAVVVAVLVPPALLVMSLPGYGRAHRRAWLLQWLCRRVLTAAGVTLTVSGTVRSGAGLVVANHSSWLDVLALAAGAPMVPVAKSEVQEWPLVGAVARRSGAVFLRRRRYRDLPAAVDAMTVLLRQGHRVQVFPEATTRCGRAVGEFHRAAFQAALNAAVVVQPATVRVSQGAVPTTATAFVGDDTLAAVVWRTLRMRGVVVELQWLRPIPAIAGSGRAPVDRAVVARLAENAVARALRQDVVLRRRRALDRPPATGWLPAAVRVSR